MLDEVELLVAGCRPEVLADDDQRFALLVAILANSTDERKQGFFMTILPLPPAG